MDKKANATNTFTYGFGLNRGELSLISRLAGRWRSVWGLPSGSSQLLLAEVDCHATRAWRGGARSAEPRRSGRSTRADRGAGYLFVTKGSKAAIEQRIALMRRGSSLVIAGMPASGVTIDLDPTSLAAAGQRVGSSRKATAIPTLVELYRGGKLRLDELASGRYPLSAINEAIADVRRGSALRNVIAF